MKSLRQPFAAILAIVLFTSFTAKEKIWVAIGDSITYLNDHPDETGNRVRKGYLTEVTEQIPHLHFINQGHNGWTAGNIAEKIDSLGIVPADIYTVFLGTNDWWQGRPLGLPEDYSRSNGNATIYGSFRIIVNKIRSLNPAAKIVLITPMQRADFVYINDPKNNAYGSYKAKNGQKLEDIANAIDYIGHSDSMTVIDLYHNSRLSANQLVRFKRLKDPASGQYKNYHYPLSAQIPFNPSTDEYPYPPGAIDVTFDGLHPSDKGNKIIAGAIVNKFRRWKW